MKRRMILTVIAVIVVAAIACTLWVALQEGSKGILYRITAEHVTAYLLGSIHISTSAMHPFGDALQKAMADCDVFVFECDTASDTSLAQLTARQTLPEDSSLANVLGDTLYNDVTAAYNALSLSTAMLNSKQPWAVINTLAVYSTAAEMGIQNVRKAISLGVDTAVQTYAKKHSKLFSYLETIDEVADTMESFSDSLTRYLLQSEIDLILKRSAPADIDTVAQWPVWWHEGNAEAFHDFYHLTFQTADEELYEEYQDKLITQRNRLMANRLDAILQQGGSYFVTVGLLHLIPEDNSIIALLRKMGYTVEQIKQP